MLNHLEERCLDDWLADFDAFKDFFLRYCYFLSKGIGYYPDVDFKILREAHTQWGVRCKVWETTLLMKDSHRLSHLKILGLLLTQLSALDWVRNLYEFDGSGDHDEGEYFGTEDERQESRQDLNAGRGAFLAYQFVMDVIEAFEIARDDRLQPFEPRLTKDLEHDIMVYLLAERGKDGQTLFIFEMGTFLFFKALYARDPSDGGGLAAG